MYDGWILRERQMDEWTLNEIRIDGQTNEQMDGQWMGVEWVLGAGE